MITSDAVLIELLALTTALFFALPDLVKQARGEDEETDEEEDL